MSNSWFRFYHEFATDPKVQMLSEADQRRYVMILCLKCCNGDVTLPDEAVAFQLRITNEEWAQTKANLISKKLIDEDNKPTAWNKRQFISDSSTARVAKHRSNKKRRCNVTVTPPDTETYTETYTETKALLSSQAELSMASCDDVQKEAGSSPEVKRQSDKKTAVVEIFEYWKLIMNHGAAKLDAKREKAIGDALKIGYSVDQLKAAVIGCSVTPFNCGENDRNARFDGLGIIFKNADQIDRFIQNSIQPPIKPVSQQPVDKKYKELN